MRFKIKYFYECYLKKAVKVMLITLMIISMFVLPLLIPIGIIMLMIYFDDDFFDMGDMILDVAETQVYDLIQSDDTLSYCSDGTYVFTA